LIIVNDAEDLIETATAAQNLSSGGKEQAVSELGTGY
jgi:hypothetical protein